MASNQDQPDYRPYEQRLNHDHDNAHNPKTNQQTGCRCLEFEATNRFMTDKLFERLPEPEYIKSIGYDLDAAIPGVPKGAVTVVYIGGGNGCTLQQFKDAYPLLESEDLIVQVCFASVDSVPGLP